MYKVVVLNGTEFHPLHVPGSEEYLLFDAELTLEMGMAGSFCFRIPPYHPYRNQIHPLSSEIHVYQEGEKIFRGRYAGSEEDFYKIGKIRCEGDLAYLLDSIQRPFEHKGSITDFLDMVLAYHNAQVEERKRFRLGRVGVVDSNNYINRSSTGYVDTLTCLREKLVATHGGFLQIREEKSIRYLDYVKDYGGSNTQTIGFGENLLDLSKYIDTSTIITALIPIGAEMETTSKINDSTSSETEVAPDSIDGGGMVQEHPKVRVDITSVNNGLDYIFDEEAVQKYGWIMGVREWKDVTLPENLLKKARAYLEECVSLPQTMELKAVDLSLIKEDISRLKVGFWTKVASAPHGITGTYLLTKRTIHLTAPEKDTILLGGSLPSLTGASAKSKLDLSLRVQQMAESTSKEIEKKVENATQLITGGLGGYIVIGRAEADGHPEEILILDAPTKEAAVNVIRLNKNGIGFSTSGYNGIYRNAWTIDGNLVADFITAGTMLFDRLRGGTLEVGGTGLGKDGQIIMKDKDGNVLCILDKNGVDVRRGVIRGSQIEGCNLELGGQGNVSGKLELKNSDKEVVVLLDENGLDVRKGKIAGTAIELGGQNKTAGILTLQDSKGEIAALLNQDGIDIRKGKITGSNLELGGQGNTAGTLTVKDAAGAVVGLMDEKGIHILKGMIQGSSLSLGGQGNAKGILTVNSQTGEKVCKMDAEGLYAIKGQIAGWEITEDKLSSGMGMIASYAGDSYADRATMNDASFKIWKSEGEGEKTLCYMGRGGFDDRGSGDSGLFYIRGNSQVEIDGDTGKINTGGMIQSYGYIKTTNGDVIAENGDVLGNNIADMLTRIEALEAKTKV